MLLILFFFFKQTTAYEMRISDWSSDVCSSDLVNSLLSPESMSSSAASRNRCTRFSARVRAESSDRATASSRQLGGASAATSAPDALFGDRKSVVAGKGVSVRVDLGGCRIIKKKKQEETKHHNVQQTTE